MTDAMDARRVQRQLLSAEESHSHFPTRHHQNKQRQVGLPVDPPSGPNRS